MNKPKEFWLLLEDEHRVYDSILTESPDIDGEIHVIDYSAYEEAVDSMTTAYLAGFEKGKRSLETQNVIMREALESIARDINVSWIDPIDVLMVRVQIAKDALGNSNPIIGRGE